VDHPLVVCREGGIEERAILKGEVVEDLRLTGRLVVDLEADHEIISVDSEKIKADPVLSLWFDESISIWKGQRLFENFDLFFFNGAR